MGVFNGYIKHRPAGSTGGFTTLYDFRTITVNKQIESKTNTIEVILFNRFGKYSGKFSGFASGFKEDDEINVYASFDDINETNDILLAGIIKEVMYKLKDKERVIVLKCQDRTYQLLNKLYFGRSGGGFNLSDGKTCAEAITDIIQWVSSDEKRGTGKITTTNIETSPTKKSSDPAGTATFDDISLSLNNKNAYDWIEELSTDPYTRYSISGSSDTYTSDRVYIFYVDANNNFYWKYPAQTGGTAINLSDGSIKVYTVSLGKSVYDIVNMIIFDAGNDPSGEAIQWYKYDDTSKQPELKVRFQPMIDIAKDIQSNEKLYGTFSGEYPASYPYVTSWGETVDNDSEYLGSIGTGNSDGSGFRGRAVLKAKERALIITKRSGDLRWKGSFELNGTTTYNPGDLLIITFDDANISSLNIRCKGVTHNISKRGWYTTITVEEDIKAIFKGDFT